MDDKIIGELPESTQANRTHIKSKMIKNPKTALVYDPMRKRV